MRILTLLSIILIGMIALMPPAMAEPEYYHQSVGLDYTSTTMTFSNGAQTITTGGINIYGERYLTKHWAVSASYCTADAVQASVTNSGDIINIGTDYYIGISENYNGYIIDGYAGLGYTIVNINSGISGGGLSYESGIKVRMPASLVDRVTSSIFYRGSSLNLTQNGGNANATGSTIGIRLNYLF